MNELRILDQIANEFSSELDVTTGKWFGKPCLKVGRKIFATLCKDAMAFKLTGKAHAEALQIKGAHLFDLQEKGRPMKEWVLIPATQSSTWSRFAELARGYVAEAAQTKKDEVISELVEARRLLLTESSLLSPTEQDEIFLGIWSVKDILAHVIGWDSTNLEATREILAGQQPSFWEHYDRDWKTYNACLVEEFRMDDFAELVGSVKKSHR